MLGYIIRRVFQAILITIGVTLIVFILLHVIPGASVARDILGPRANAAQIARSITTTASTSRSRFST